MKALQKGVESAAKSLTRVTQRLEKLSQQLEKKVTTKAAPKRKSAPKKPAAKSRPAKKTAAKPKKATASDAVLQIIKRAKNPVDTATIQKKTGFSKKKIQPIVYRLKKQNKIKSAGKGLYQKA